MNPKIRNGIIIAVLSILLLAICGRIIWTKVHHNNSWEKRAARWRAKNWPAERKLTAEKVKARQAIDETHGAVSIDLEPYINAKLTEAPLCWKGNNADNLAELPAGKNIYAGVPFDVEGSIQLMGGWLKHYGKSFPTEVDSIPIHRQCAKIHLLHGDSYVDPQKNGAIVAKLVVHYEDGSTREINMVSGQQVFDWWQPTFTTGIPVSWRTPAPDTELAWIGSNPYLREGQPDLSLCLYRSSFQNPRPEVAISIVDYVSTEAMTCPFLVGLTVE